MPIMKELEVDDVVYTTVGEASVTQVVSTGTKIATIAIDGTSTDLYAPSGGSPEAMTDAEVEAAVSSVSVEHSITVSGSAASYTANGRFVLSAATAGEIVLIRTNRTITSISSVPTVEFETDSAGSTDARLFAMPNEAITITVTVSSGGGSN